MARSNRSADDDAAPGTAGIAALSPDAQEALKEAAEEVGKKSEKEVIASALDETHAARLVLSTEELKDWVRRELHLAANGVAEERRKEVNP